MRAAQITGLVSVIALLGCAFPQTAVMFLGPGLMLFVASIYDSYYLRQPNATLGRRHFVSAMQVLWFTAAAGQFYLAEHDQNLHGFDGEESFMYNCKSSRVTLLAACSAFLFLLLLPIVWLADPTFGRRSCRAAQHTSSETIARILSQGQEYVLECQIAAIWRYVGKHHVFHRAMTPTVLHITQ